MGYVHAPVAVIEALVALSIVFVARELLRGSGETLTPQALGHRADLRLAARFAFAGALAETGLPQDEIPLALLLFNLGVEAGQLLFVGALVIAALGRSAACPPPACGRG